MGKNDEANAWLDKAYARHSNIMNTPKVDPAWDPLRSGPRFLHLLQRVGLAPKSSLWEPIRRLQENGTSARCKTTSERVHGVIASVPTATSL